MDGVWSIGLGWSVEEDTSKLAKLTEGAHSEGQEHDLVVENVLNGLLVGHGLVAFVSASQLSPSALKVGPGKCFSGRFGLGFRGALWWGIWHASAGRRVGN